MTKSETKKGKTFCDMKIFVYLCSRQTTGNEKESKNNCNHLAIVQ